MAKEYEVKISEIFPVLKKKVSTDKTELDVADQDDPDTHYDEPNIEDIKDTSEDNSNDKETTSSGNAPSRKPSRRKAALAAKEAFKHFKVNKSNVEVDKSAKADNHAWIYSDWLELHELEDDPIVPEPARKPEQRRTISIDLPLPSTPELESMIQFNIEQFSSHQTRFGLLDLFPPVEEPEPEWDHSPQFLTNDNHVTWDESMNVDDKVNQALVQRRLFQVSISDSVSESLTSSAASDDSTFLDDLQLDAHEFTNHRRSGVVRRNRRLVELDDTSEEPDVADVADVTEASTEHAMDTTYTANNLVDQELELEEEYGDHDDTQIEADDDAALPEVLNNDEETNDLQEANRSRRSSRREIDYKYLHTFGHRK